MQMRTLYTPKGQPVRCWRDDYGTRFAEVDGFRVWLPRACLYVCSSLGDVEVSNTYQAQIRFEDALRRLINGAAPELVFSELSRPARRTAPIEW